MKAEGFFVKYLEEFEAKFLPMLGDLHKLKGDPFDKVFDLVQKDKSFMNMMIEQFS